jgi:hypothetical protein
MIDGARYPDSLNVPWLTLALNDLFVGPLGRLREFLRTYGNETSHPRAAFIRLTDCYRGLEAGIERDPGLALVTLAEAFPDPTELRTLKHDCVRRLIESSDLDSTWAAVYFLVQTQEAKAFEHAAVEFGPYVERIWQNKRADVLSLLGRMGANDNAHSFVDKLAEVIAPEDVPSIWREQTTVLPLLIHHRPQLATYPAAWDMSSAGQRDLWEGLVNSTKDGAIWGLAVSAMIQMNVGFNERVSVELAGDSITNGLATWLGHGDVRLPSRGWRDALRGSLKASLDAGDLTPEVLAFVTWVFPSYELRAIRGDRPDVQRLVREGIPRIPESLRAYTLFWLTALGLQSNDEAGVMLLAAAFLPVYEAVARSHYPAEAWDILAPILPELYFGLDWDRCRRMRGALREWLRKNRRYVDLLMQRSSGTELRRLVESLR